MILQKEIDKNPVIHSTDDTVMAVIDDFISYRHPEFMHNGQSRFFAVWDQEINQSGKPILENYCSCTTIERTVWS